MILGLVTLDAVFPDQGAMPSPVPGELAASADYVHDCAHDGRRLFADLCRSRARS